MIILLIIGIVCLLSSFVLMKQLDKHDKKWLNIALAICMIVGMLCVGIIACTSIGNGGEIRMKP